MRLRELVETTVDTISDIKNDIVSFLAVLSSEGITTIATSQLVNDMVALGHTVDETSILDVLGEIDLVASANAETIELASDEFDRVTNDDTAKREQDKVKKDATKQAKKDL